MCHLMMHLLMHLRALLLRALLLLLLLLLLVQLLLRHIIAVSIGMLTAMARQRLVPNLAKTSKTLLLSGELENSESNGGEGERSIAHLAVAINVDACHLFKLVQKLLHYTSGVCRRWPNDTVE